MDDMPWNPSYDEQWAERLRGLLLGLALGEAYDLAGGRPRPLGLIATGRGTELALTTTDGLVRWLGDDTTLSADGLTRSQWDALRRWGSWRGVQPSRRDPDWPVLDGELAGLQRRGRRAKRGPEVAALLAARPGSLGRGVDSEDPTVLGRLLPLAVVRALVGGNVPAPDPHLWAVMQLTHRAGWGRADPELACGVVGAASLGLAGAVGPEIFPNWARADMVTLLGQFIHFFDETDPAGSLEHAAAMSGADLAVEVGLFAAMTCRTAETATEALELAATSTTMPGSGMVAGALLGAQHGASAFPESELQRLDLGEALTRVGSNLVDAVLTSSMRG